MDADVKDFAMALAGKGKSGKLNPALNSCCFVSSLMKSMRVKLLFLFALGVVLLIMSFLNPMLIWDESRWVEEPPVDVALISSAGLKPVSLAANNRTILELAGIDQMEATEAHVIAKVLDHQSEQVFSKTNRDLQSHRRQDGSLSREERQSPYKSRPEPWEAELSRQIYWQHWDPFKEMVREWADKKRFQPEIMGQMLELVKAPLDRHYGRGKGAKPKSGPTGRYKTCAVVGNSGVLLSKHHGAFIDSHEMVIRINTAETHFFKKHVGEKTTLSFMNSNVLHSCARRITCPCFYHGPDVPILAYMCTPAHLMDITRCGPMRETPMLATDPRFDMLCFRIVKWYSLTQYTAGTGKSVEEWSKRYGGKFFHYSSGFQAVMLALSLCDNVDLFGFGKIEGQKHHYHSNQKAELSLHDYEAEYLFYSDVMHNNSASIPFLQDAGITIPPLRIFA